MSDDQDEPVLRPYGHRYQEPETRETTVGKEVVYAGLGVVVVVLAVLIATGTVPIFSGS
jgi:hypothetical protein